MLNECNKFFKKRDDDKNPPIIINQIKPGIIEQGIKSALSTGTFGKKKGVAQMMARLSTVQALSSLRRVNTPSFDASNNKLTNPRHIHSSSIGYICMVETPEGHKIGMVKNLSMMGNITINLPSQTALIKGILLNHVISINSVPLYQIKNYTKVFLNGEWLGLTNTPRELYNFMKQKKFNGEIDMCTSIIHEIKSTIENSEIKIYSDGGRMYRPLLRVENNELLLTKDHIKSIGSSVKSWNEFLVKYPGVIEYVDVDEQSNAMLAMFPADIAKMRRIKNTFTTPSKVILNRYDETVYVNHTHCEIHPSMKLGIVANNIPFLNSQPGTRNVYQYSQSRHAMGIFATNWKDRMDISYILYNTQRPLISSRNAKYIGTDILPAGENVVLAIACYSGYNVEDSVILNKSSIDRGLFRSTSLKKHKSLIQKNQTTSENDIFTKPDINKVVSIKQGSYDKLNDEGIAPPETIIEYGDVMIGKISPIQPLADTNKTFKDSSESYKEKVPATIDRVWTDIENHEGYDLRKIRTRSERIPVIGDKVCCYTADHEVLTSNGWKNITKLNYNDMVAVLVNGATEYIEPTEIQQFNYHGFLYEIKSTHVSLCITANHRMYSRDPVLPPNPQNHPPYSIRLANEIAHTPQYFKNMNAEVFVGVNEWEMYETTCPVYCCTVPTQDGIIYVRRNGYEIWCGNSRSAQKGTVGIILPQADMPFNKHGICPDMIMNANALPSRMTSATLIECLIGKVSALRGHETDGTPYRIWDIEYVKDLLESLGYDRSGTEELYNGMTGEKLTASIYIGPTFYQRLKHMVNDKIHCLTLDHEVLTANGWKFYHELTMDDKIATLKENNLVYDKPIELLYYPDYKGQLYNIKTQQIDLSVTDNHRMWVSRIYGRKHEWQPYKLIDASKIMGKHVKYQKSAIWDVPDYQFILPSITTGNNIVMPEKIVDMDAWLIFFGIWIAEGWTSSNKDKRWKNSKSHITVICQCKPRIKKIIYEVITKLGYNYNIDKDKIRIYNKQLYTYMKQFSVGAPFKSLPEWVWNLSSNQCKQLITGMMLGDGTFPAEFTNWAYYTSSVKLANDFMKLCLHAGWSANITKHHSKGKQTMINDRVIKSNYDLWRLGIVKTKNNPAINHTHVKQQNIQYEEMTPYQGPVFCLQVPSEVFYVRRNGKPVWTGNSRARGPLTVLTRQCPEGRSRNGGLRCGEMERDSMISHGIALFLKERMMETADGYSTYVCGECGLFAQRKKKGDDKPYATTNDVYFCPSCKNKNKINKIRIPYAFKLLVQEMMAMNIAPRIRT